jgi:hypothetical protein
MAASLRRLCKQRIVVAGALSDVVPVLGMIRVLTEQLTP